MPRHNRKYAWRNIGQVWEVEVRYRKWATESTTLHVIASNAASAMRTALQLAVRDQQLQGNGDNTGAWVETVRYICTVVR